VGETNMIRVQLKNDHAMVVIEEEPEAVLPDSKLPEIITKMRDPDSPPGEILRLIAYEIGLIVAMGDPTRNSRVKDHNVEVKSLRALAEIVKKNAQRSKADFLNLDGRKFQFVLTCIQDVLATAAHAVLGKTDPRVDAIMKRFNDFLDAEGEDLRRRTAEIGRDPGTERSEASGSTAATL
jgi:hypothetical protein